MSITAPAARRRLATLATAVVLGAGPLTACSSDNVDCQDKACTVTLDRGVSADTKVLGVEVKLIGVDNGVVRVSVAGNEVSVPVDGSARSSGFDITVQKVTAKQVVIHVQTG